MNKNDIIQLIEELQENNNLTFRLFKANGEVFCLEKNSSLKIITPELCSYKDSEGKLKFFLINEIIDFNLLN
jgi:hypothetical protein